MASLKLKVVDSDKSELSDACLIAIWTLKIEWKFEIGNGFYVNLTQFSLQ